MNEMMNIHAAKTHFSKLIARVANGEEIVIARDGVPIARLVPYAAANAPRALGTLAGKVWIAEDAFETPSWLVDAFEGVGGESAPPVVSPGKPKRVAESRRK